MKQHEVYPTKHINKRTKQLVIKLILTARTTNVRQGEFISTRCIFAVSPEWLARLMLRLLWNTSPQWNRSFEKLVSLWASVAKQPKYMYFCYTAHWQCWLNWVHWYNKQDICVCSTHYILCVYLKVSRGIHLHHTWGGQRDVWTRSRTYSVQPSDVCSTCRKYMHDLN